MKIGLEFHISLHARFKKVKISAVYYGFETPTETFITSYTLVWFREDVNLQYFSLAPTSQRIGGHSMNSNVTETVSSFSSVNPILEALRVQLFIDNMVRLVELEYQFRVQSVELNDVSV